MDYKCTTRVVLKVVDISFKTLKLQSGVMFKLNQGSTLKFCLCYNNTGVPHIWLRSALREESSCGRTKAEAILKQ